VKVGLAVTIGLFLILGVYIKSRFAKYLGEYSPNILWTKNDGMGIAVFG
jgi:hypothetical protein